VFPRDEEVVERTGAERMRFDGPGADGRFEITALPPGDYLVVAAADLDPRQGFDPDVLDAYRDAATPVRIAHGEPQTITLTLAVP
jgi:hypothetical protein